MSFSHAEVAFRHCVNSLKLLEDGFLFLFRFLLRTSQRALAFTANMASRVDSKVPTPNMQPPKRQMVHLKTKEECRLGNETIQVWTVEMPSRYAEGVLK